MTDAKANVLILWLLAIVFTFLLGLFTGSSDKDRYDATFESFAVLEDSKQPPAIQTRPQPWGQETLQAAVCSNAILREYYRKSDYFPSDGEWTATAGNLNASFSPSLCTFRWIEPPTDHIRQGLSANKMSSILLMGNANMHKLYLRMVQFFTPADVNACVMVKRERLLGNGFIVDAENLDETQNEVILDRLRGLRRPCDTCLGQRDTCRADDNGAAPLTLEYMPTFSVDFMSATSKDQKDSHKPSFQASAFLVDLINHLLPGRDPDVIIFTPPYDFLKRGALEEAKRDIANLVHVIQTHIPATTHVYWLPPWEDSDQPETLTTSTAGQDVLSTEELNRLLFEALRIPLLVEPLHRYGFFDLWALQQAWGRQSPDEESAWYSAVVGMLLQLMVTEEQ